MWYYSRFPKAKLNKGYDRINFKKHLSNNLIVSGLSQSANIQMKAIFLLGSLFSNIFFKKKDWVCFCL